jgi:hypothetical protein
MTGSSRQVQMMVPHRQCPLMAIFFLLEPRTEAMAFHTNPCPRPGRPKVTSALPYRPSAKTALSHPSSGRALTGEELLLVGLAVEGRLNRLLARNGWPSLLRLRVL